MIRLGDQRQVGAALTDDELRNVERIHIQQVARVFPIFQVVPFGQYAAQRTESEFAVVFKLPGEHQAQFALG